VTVAAPPLYLLDTNVLVHFVRGSEVWVRVRDRYQPLLLDPRPIISVVTVGELRSLALQWKWGPKKLDQLEYAIGFFKTLTIDDPDVIRAYAAIDAHSEEVGHPLGKNDVWIAATAAVTAAHLLTTDHDFDHLAPRFFARDWIDPDTSVP
jgi:tRNA(fMet)-specific endonuclease VapC